jgi:vancomycin permeability regulator SanA
MFSLDNIKRRQQTVKRYFNKSAKVVKFKVNEKVLLWDSAHADRGRNSKFQKLWLVPFKITFVLGANSYILKDLEERLFSYRTNGFHLK